MNKTFRLIAVGVVLLLLIVGVLLLGHGSSSRAALEKYKAELRAKGEILDFTRLAYSSPAERQNWNSNLANLTSNLGKSRPVIHPGQVEVRRFTKGGIARAFWLEEVPPPPFRPDQKAGTWDQFEQDVERNNTTLQQLRRLAQEPISENGSHTNTLLAIPPVLNFVAIRSAAQWLVSEAECNLHQDRIAEALEDLEAMVGLAERCRYENSLVGQMIRVAVANLGLALTWDALQSTQWDASQLASLQRAWETVDLLDAVERGFTGERAFGENSWDKSRRSGTQAKQMLRSLRSGSGGGVLTGLFEDFVVAPTYYVTSINDDELFYLKSMQATLEGIRGLRLNEPWPKARLGIDKQTATISRIAGTSQKIHYLISLMAIPNYSRATQTALRAETERQMTVIAIALRRYQMAHHSIASSLDPLVPEFLKAVPIDHMSGAPFRYKVITDKEFLLYSVGEDGVDDGGDATPGKGMWDGHDAVWPRAENGQGSQR